MRKLAALAMSLLMAVAVAACNKSSSTSTGPDPDPGPSNKYAYGRWHLQDIRTPNEGWDLVFSTDMTFVGYAAGRPTPTITGPYAIGADGRVTGNWKATGANTRVGTMEAHFVDADATILYFKFTETNAFDNPGAVNGVISTEHQGTNLEPRPPGNPDDSDDSDDDRQPPASSGVDAIDPATIVWDGGPNPSGWPITAEMRDLVIHPNGTPGCTVHNPPMCETVGPCVFFNFTNPGSWPLVGGKIIGSGWIIAKIDGVWHGGVWEGIKPGGSYFVTTEQCSNQPQQFIQANGAVAGHHFQKGEEVGFMLSTVARGPHPSQPTGRSPIIKTTYPF